MSQSLSRDSRIFVAGHRGMVGSAIVRALTQNGHSRLLLKTHAELDLSDAAAVSAFMKTEKPDVVIDAAARVGGIHANATYPADFLRENMTMQMNLITSAWQCGVKRLLFLGSSCIYPRLAPQPMKEECLLTSALEETNEAYALAKISGLKYCQFLRRQYGVLFHSAMPTNLYGPYDNFDLHTSHVLPALIRKVHEAKLAGAPQVPVWGSGNPRREFLHVDDLADACVFLLEHYDSPEIVNIGAVAPEMRPPLLRSTLSFCHRYVSVPLPLAATENVAVPPAQRFCATGCCGRYNEHDDVVNVKSAEVVAAGQSGLAEITL
ncbi:MAG TPA: GDP-L-fucose synthase, partial [Opitutales bacterium]|nr:GDP-L-fucose synthase [Opitutales bacterium]